MAKIRVGQLAKELNLKVPDVVARLREIGIESKTNLSTVDDEAADRLRASAPRAAGGAAAHAPSISKGAKSSKAAKAPRSEPASQLNAGIDRIDRDRAAHRQGRSPRRSVHAVRD